MDRYKETAEMLRNVSVVDSLMKPALIKAADVIEELCEKLISMCCEGEWVYCWDNRNLPSESGKYNVIMNFPGVFFDLEFDAENKVWKDEDGNSVYVIAWWRKYDFVI